MSPEFGYEIGTKKINLSVQYDEFDDLLRAQQTQLYFDIRNMVGKHLIPYLYDSGFMMSKSQRLPIKDGISLNINISIAETAYTLDNFFEGYMTTLNRNQFGRPEYKKIRAYMKDAPDWYLERLGYWH